MFDFGGRPGAQLDLARLGSALGLGLGLGPGLELVQRVALGVHAVLGVVVGVGVG